MSAGELGLGKLIMSTETTNSTKFEDGCTAASGYDSVESKKKVECKVPCKDS